MKLDATPSMEVDAREPSNDHEEKMTPTVPNQLRAKYSSDAANISPPIILYSYLADGKGGKQKNKR